MSLKTRQQLQTDLSYTSGLGNKKTSLTIHQTGNPSYGANAAAHANLQSRLGMPSTSWHWTVDDTEAVQSYLEDVCCWHAGDGARGPGNLTSVSIELCINIDGDYNKTISNGIELSAMLLRDMGRTANDIVQHNHWSGKNCPAQIRQQGIWGDFKRRVNDILTGDNTPPAIIKPSTPTQLTVDGYWGSDTTSALQLIFGTPRDGIVSSQPTVWSAFNPGLTSGWEWVVDPHGSQLIGALQRDWGAPADGLIGPATIKALQRSLNMWDDGVLDGPSPAIMELQRVINRRLERRG